MDMDDKTTATPFFAISRIACCSGLILVALFTYSIACDRINPLPDIKGFGQIQDLKNAIITSKSGKLLNILCAFIDEESPISRRQMMVKLLFEWANIEYTCDDLLDSDILYVRISEFVEKSGRNKKQHPIDPAQDKCQRELTMKLFEEIKNTVFSNLSLSIHYRNWYRVARMAVRQNHNLEIPVYINSMPLFMHLRRVFLSNENNEESVIDFFGQFIAYDSYGIEFAHATKQDFDKIVSVIKEREKINEDNKPDEFLDFLRIFFEVHY